MKDTEMFKRKNGQILCDHDMQYKQDASFVKWVSYMESRARLGMRSMIPFMITGDAYYSDIDGKLDSADRELDLEGNIVINDI